MATPIHFVMECFGFVMECFGFVMECFGLAFHHLGSALLEQGRPSVYYVHHDQGQVCAFPYF